MKGYILLLIVFFASSRVYCQELDTIRPATGLDSVFCTVDKNGNIHMRTELSSKDIKAFEDGAKQLVEEFIENVAKLWRPWTEEEKQHFNPKLRDDFKTEIEDATCNLFIANAERFITHETAEYRVYRLYDGIDYYLDQYGRQKKAIGAIHTDQYGVNRITVEEEVLHHPVRMQIADPKKNHSYWRFVKKYLNNVKNSHLYERVSFDIGDIWISDKLVQDQPGRYVGTVCFYQDFTGIRGDGVTINDRTYRCITIYVYATVVNEMIMWNMKFGDIRTIVIN